jgi:hypothetical protein
MHAPINYTTYLKEGEKEASAFLILDAAVNVILNGDAVLCDQRSLCITARSLRSAYSLDSYAFFMELKAEGLRVQKISVKAATSLFCKKSAMLPKVTTTKEKHLVYPEGFVDVPGICILPLRQKGFHEWAALSLASLLQFRFKILANKDSQGDNFPKRFASSRWHQQVIHNDYRY